MATAKKIKYDNYDVLVEYALKDGHGNEINVAAKADLVDGKIPSAQLPGYVDDVVEYANKASFPKTGEAGKIYVDLSTNLTYRWGGTSYVEISASIALGETATTAYPGDKGKANAEHITGLQNDLSALNQTVTGIDTALDNTVTLNTAQIITGDKHFNGDLQFGPNDDMFISVARDNADVMQKAIVIGKYMDNGGKYPIAVFEPSGITLGAGMGIMPDDLTASLGGKNNRWNSVHAEKYIGDKLVFSQSGDNDITYLTNREIAGSSGAITGVIGFSGDLIPERDSSFIIGSQTSKVAGIYVNNLAIGAQTLNETKLASLLSNDGKITATDVTIGE